MKADTYGSALVAALRSRYPGLFPNRLIPLGFVWWPNWRPSMSIDPFDNCCMTVRSLVVCLSLELKS